MILASVRLRPAHRLNLLSSLHRAAALYRSRRALARLDTAALADIGLSADDARTEAARGIWDAPANWRR